MSYIVQACESPSIKYGAITWEGGIFNDYESALLEAAKYMHETSNDFGGNPESSIEFLAQCFDIPAEEKKGQETFLQWIQRVVDESLDAEDLPDPNTSEELCVIDMETKEIIHKWNGCTIFHSTKGLCTLWYPANST